MDILRPYWVEFRVGAMVMARSDTDAVKVGESCRSTICSDNGLEVDFSTPIDSLAELRATADGWDGDCVPYGGDGETKLKDLLPEEAPFKDTKTLPLFPEGVHGNV